jgi:hypothetical protein
MLRLAHLGVAPGNADAEVRDASWVTAVGPHAQAGLAEAVRRLVGHRPGGCPVCAPAALSERSRLLLDLLGFSELSAWRRPLRAVRLLLSRQSS